MEAYHQQSISPFFAGQYRQRGSGFWALAAGIGRAAIPLAKKFLWPVAKKYWNKIVYTGGTRDCLCCRQKEEP